MQEAQAKVKMEIRKRKAVLKAIKTQITPEGKTVATTVAEVFKDKRAINEAEKVLRGLKVLRIIDTKEDTTLAKIERGIKRGLDEAEKLRRRKWGMNKTQKAAGRC